MTAPQTRSRLRLVALTGVAATALALTACASGGDNGTGSASPPAPSGSDSPTATDVVAGATAAVKEYFANNSAAIDNSGIAPSSLKGKKVLYLSAGLSSPSGTAGLESMTAIAKELGFEVVPFDGQFTPSKYQEGLRQAVATKVDGVILFGVDCPGNEQPLKELQDAGIPVIGAAGVDCGTAKAGAENLFAGEVLYPVGAEKRGLGYDLYYNFGVAQADYIIAKSNGQAKVIQFDVPDFQVTAASGKGFRDRLAECTTCELLETVNIGVADFGPNLAQKADQALLQHPDATALGVNYDDLMTLGLANSVVQSGRNDELLVVAGGGLEPAAELIRSNGGLDAGYLYDYPWDHYAAVATLNNVIAGAPAPVAGQPVVFYDAENNLPATGGWTPEVDFRAAFNEAWGA